MRDEALEKYEVPKFDNSTDAESSTDVPATQAPAIVAQLVASIVAHGKLVASAVATNNGMPPANQAVAPVD
ncbi:hypothetical protein V6N13_125317 [Hibiscus sabdariffa]